MAETAPDAGREKDREPRVTERTLGYGSHGR